MPTVSVRPWSCKPRNQVVTPWQPPIIREKCILSSRLESVCWRLLAICEIDCYSLSHKGSEACQQIPGNLWLPGKISVLPNRLASSCCQRLREMINKEVWLLAYCCGYLQFAWIIPTQLQILANCSLSEISKTVTQTRS